MSVGENEISCIGNEIDMKKESRTESFVGLSPHLLEELEITSARKEEEVVDPTSIEIKLLTVEQTKEVLNPYFQEIEGRVSGFKSLVLGLTEKEIDTVKKFANTLRPRFECVSLRIILNSFIMDRSVSFKSYIESLIPNSLFRPQD